MGLFCADSGCLRDEPGFDRDGIGAERVRTTLDRPLLEIHDMSLPHRLLPRLTMLLTMLFFRHCAGRLRLRWRREQPGHTRAIARASTGPRACAAACTHARAAGGGRPIDADG